MVRKYMKTKALFQGRMLQTVGLPEDGVNQRVKKHSTTVTGVKRVGELELGQSPIT